MKKIKQISAFIGVIILVGLYIITLISALLASPHSHGLFLASIYSSIIIPIFIYAVLLIGRLLKGSNYDAAMKLQSMEQPRDKEDVNE